MLHPLGVRRNRHWSNLLVEEEFDAASFSWVKMDTLDRTIQIAGGPIELLAFPLIRMAPNHVPIRSAELCIDVQKSLDKIIPRWEFVQRLQRISEFIAVEHGRGAGSQLFHILAEELSA